VLAHERSGPTGTTPVLLVHAGIADRRMWDPVWPALTATRDVVRVDLRGFGESDTTPEGPWSHSDDVLATLDELGIDRAHLVGCSQGAGVAAEVAVRRPSLAVSLVLAAPGGALFVGPTDALRDFWKTENDALERGDIDAAVEGNLRVWVDGARSPEASPQEVRAAVAVMQRRAFEVMLGWPDEAWEAEQELDPPLIERLHDLTAPTLVVSGALDVDAVGHAARAIRRGAPNSRAVVWPDVAHLPSMERPDHFAAEVLGWIALAEVEQAAE
jgi:pimeloyl-ACP methyl ester carboxylesterase